MEIKTKIKKWDPLKFKNFFKIKEKLNKMKRQLSQQVIGLQNFKTDYDA